MRLVLRTCSGRLGDGTINYYLDAKLSRFVFIDGQTWDPSRLDVIQRFRSMDYKDGFQDFRACKWDWAK